MKNATNIILINGEEGAEVYKSRKSCFLVTGAITRKVIRYMDYNYIWHINPTPSRGAEHYLYEYKICYLTGYLCTDGFYRLAAADTIRARGVARSNQIIGESLRNNEAYLHWLWIDNIEKNPQAVIYVPTEANLPILETGRRPWLKDTAR